MLNTTFQSPKIRKKRFTACCVIILTVLIALLINGCITKEGSKTGNENICNDCNIILIIVDTLRADHLPCYGYYRNTAPNICDFAKEGILFENAFAQSANTFPSHMSIFTSLYPSSHGVKNIFKDKLDEEILTLPQILKIYNYNTAWSGPLTDPALDFEAGFGRGFDEKFNSVFRKNGQNECNNSELFGWLEKQGKERNNFFLFYHTYKVHVPYMPKTNLFDNRSILNITRQEFLNKQLQILKERFYNNPDSFFSALNISDNDTKEKMMNETFWNLNNFGWFYPSSAPNVLTQAGIDPPSFEVFWENINRSDSDELTYVTSLYDSEIVEADTCLNEFFDKLKEEDLYNKSIIIVTADHGEEFMEHGSIDHSQLYDEVVHVPLIIKTPGTEGSIVEGLAKSIDIMPTILSLLEIPFPFYVQGKNLLNNDFKDLVYAEFADKKLLRSERWSFIMHDDGTMELYDLIKDSKQTKNLAQEKTKVTEEMKTNLQNWSSTLPKYYKKSYDFDTSISNETRENIIKTGYW
jgi:arylsulfatase A-like enzyme